jgi:predicted phosphodiesterase
MRYLVLSDVHANAPALAATLRDARRRAYDAVMLLGDLVGYYPFAREVVATLAELEPTVRLLGNHDAILLALAEGAPPPSLSDGSLVTDTLARQLETLTTGDLAFLRTLVPEAQGERWQAAHGAFRSRFEYVATLQSAQANLPLLRAPVGLVGHTHVPKAFVMIETPEGDLWRTVAFRGTRGQYRLPPGARALFNPGAVGQPRDGSPLASYALYDDERQTFDVHRVEYAFDAVQRRVREAGYHESLALRLPSGR